MVKVTWSTSFSASAIHAAYAMSVDGESVHPNLVSLLPSAQHLNTLIIEWLDSQALSGWQLLVGMASSIASNRSLAEQWLRRVRQNGPSFDSHAAQLAGAIGDIEAATTLIFPNMLEQLELRSRPIQDQWHGFGRGLMAHLRRLTEANWLVEQAEGVFLQPVQGGAGFAFSAMNRFAIEAVLTNPLPELPEVVRVAWLVAQLQSDLPAYSDELGPLRAQPVAALASLVATLAAAEVLELSRCNEDTIQLAIEHWQIPIPTVEDVSSALVPWWETYLQTRPTWTIALKALDKMLSGKFGEGRKRLARP
jgi:hypothetical protein